MLYGQPRGEVSAIQFVVALWETTAAHYRYQSDVGMNVLQRTDADLATG